MPTGRHGAVPCAAAPCGAPSASGRAPRSPASGQAIPMKNAIVILATPDPLSGFEDAMIAGRDARSASGAEAAFGRSAAQPCSSRRTTCLDDLHAEVAVVEAGDVGEALAAVLLEIVAVLAVELLQRLQAIGREARAPRSPCASRRTSPAPSRSRRCRASAIPRCRSATGRSVRIRSVGKPKASRISRPVLHALAMVGVALEQVSPSARRGTRRGSPPARSRAWPGPRGSSRPCASM